ncbi:MAG TPA: fatty acid hydroxylase family protein [Limnobacter sp.]|uniref:fatty acid hydroxylase family protein n=1 Tax=Limnobacter sp. TaxID=2003368 RepID=UPI002ED8EE85
MHAKVKPFPNDRAVDNARQQFRAENIAPGYRGEWHLAFTCTLALAVIIGSGMALHAVHALEWLTVPITWLYANFAEWAGHRFVMHRPVKGLGLVYRRHALQHHRFFTHDHMEIDNTRDFKAVLFPPVLVSFFVCAFFAPIFAMLAWALSLNVALLFLLTGMAYFVNYELFHLAYHLKEDHWVHRLPGFHRLARLHTTHHDQRLMAHKNFNISYPLTDWLMRTWDRR